MNLSSCCSPHSQCTFPALTYITHNLKCDLCSCLRKSKILEDRASSYANGYDYHEYSAAISVCTRGFHVPEFIYHPIANLQILQGGRWYPEAYSSEGFSPSQSKVSRIRQTNGIRNVSLKLLHSFAYHLMSYKLRSSFHCRMLFSKYCQDLGRHKHFSPLVPLLPIWCTWFSSYRSICNSCQSENKEVLGFLHKKL